MPRVRRWFTALVLVAAVAAPALAGESSEPASCLECHARDAKRADAAPANRRIDDAAWLTTAHRESCLQCHPDMETVPHAGAKAARVDCAACHDGEAATYAGSAHGEALAKRPGAPDSPSCSSCHGTHDIRGAKEPASRTHRKNLPDTCGTCHGSGGVRKEHGVGATVDDFRRSIHGVELLEKGNAKAPSCADCHSAHDLRHRRDPKAETFKMNIPSVCAKCHAGIAGEYREGIHGRALALGNMDAPACTDCHTEHSIRAPSDPASTVHGLEVARTTCPSCHNAERLVRKYGLPADRVATYRDSYHGLAGRQGDGKAAHCGSCHGVHRVLPASDPASTIAPGNLAKTCGQCHPDAGPGFLEGQVHTAPDPARARVAWWARIAYGVLIPVVIGGMLLHNGVILWKFVRDRGRARREKGAFVRFSRAEVAMHAALAVSFVALAVTGFALTSPEAEWVRALRAVGMSEAVRSGIHRGAAVLLGATAVAHVAYSAFARHGRYSFARMWPRRQDLRDMAANLRYHLGRAEKPPRFDRFDYTMKAEYWALAWGTLLMAATGLALWFKVGASDHVPRWMIYVAERVHFYEAILACLAIVAWHFFFVMAHPDAYPIDTSMVTGRVTAEEMAHRHPLEHERLKGTPYEEPPPGGPA